MGLDIPTSFSRVALNVKIIFLLLLNRVKRESKYIFGERMHMATSLVAGLLASEVKEFVLMISFSRNVFPFCSGDDAGALTGHSYLEFAARKAEVWCRMLQMECPRSQHTGRRMVDFPSDFSWAKWFGLLELLWEGSSCAAGINKPEQRAAAFHPVLFRGWQAPALGYWLLLVSVGFVSSIKSLSFPHKTHFYPFDQNTAMSWPSFSTRLRTCCWALQSPPVSLNSSFQSAPRRTVYNINSEEQLSSRYNHTRILYSV